MTNYPDINIKIELSNEESMNELIENHENNRNILRKKILNEFVKERAGEGTKTLASNYKYFVETLEDGKRIYLTRPAFLNKGFDFVIHVEDLVFMNGKNHPRHKDILDDIKNKISFVSDDLKGSLKDDLYTMIEKVYYCVDVELIMENFEMTDELPENFPGYSLEMLLKVIKWFFIEQDICYWNYSGREMFLKGVSEILKK